MTMPRPSTRSGANPIAQPIDVSARIIAGALSQYSTELTDLSAIIRHHLKIRALYCRPLGSTLGFSNIQEWRNQDQQFCAADVRWRRATPAYRSLSALYSASGSILAMWRWWMAMSMVMA